MISPATVSERFRSTLRDERNASVLGIALGVTFAVCFATGLISHLLQHPQSWFRWPAHPVNLYRITQGAHVLCGIASVPLLLAKLWVVYPKLWEWPPVRDVAHALERLSLLPLVGGALFQLVTGVINIDYWYSPMPFFFPAAHYWVAWIVTGALIVHVGAKATTVRRALSTPCDVPAAPSTSTLTRRGFLGVVGGAAAVLVVTVGGDTISPLRRLAVLAPRRIGNGPQHVPVNRAALEARVVDAALDPTYRLELTGRHVAEPMTWSLDELRRLPQRRAGLPITCVEGWSVSASWEGVSLRHLLDLAGVPRHVRVRVESLEQHGLYGSSVIETTHSGDPDTLLALRLNDVPLDLDHGYPVRLIAPDRPGVLQTKWIRRVVVL